MDTIIRQKRTEPKTRVLFMPFIDMPHAHHYDTVITTMPHVQSLSLVTRQQFTIMISDLQLYTDSDRFPLGVS